MGSPWHCKVVLHFLTPVPGRASLLVNLLMCLSFLALNSTSSKNAPPSLTFFAAVNESTTLFGLFEKAVNDFIGPLFA